MARIMVSSVPANKIGEQTTQHDPNDDCASNFLGARSGKDGAAELRTKLWQGEGRVYRIDGSWRPNHSSRFCIILLLSEQCCSFLRKHCESVQSNSVSTYLYRPWSLPCQRYAGVPCGQAVAEDS